MPPLGAAVRSATPADVEELVRLQGVLFSIEADFQPEPERQRRGLELMLAEPERRCVLVAEESSRVVGMIAAQLVVSTAEGAPSALVEDMVVDESARGRGLGRRLVQALEAWARGRGATRMQLLADRDNRSALRFYERMGWRATQLVCWRRGGAPGGIPR